MNEPTVRLETGPEIAAFVEQVRARLSDLTDEEREELVGGLEADIAELVNDGGSVSELGDPRAYADELRAAAGIERSAGAGKGIKGLLGARRPPRPGGQDVQRLLDTARREWSEIVGAPRLRAAWEFLTTLRPVWWVLRAWVAMQLLDLATQSGDMATPVPTLGGPLVGSLIWLVAIVASVQIGRNRIWPGSGEARKVLARVVLLGLNAFALLMTPIALGQFPASGTWEDQHYMGSFERPRGLSNGDEYVQNVFPYDAQGRPLEGVQLFDQNGNPLNVARFAGEEFSGPEDRLTVTYPWLNGEKQLYNVFPLPRREQSLFRVGSRVERDAWTSTNPPFLPVPPLAVVPPVTLPLAPGATDGADGSVDPTEGSAEPSPAPEPAEETASAEAGQRDSENPEGR